MADYDFDEQDQSETFDETHIDDEGDGDINPDEADDVLDVTQRDGDSDDDDNEHDLSDELSLDGVEPKADSLLGVDEAPVSQTDAQSNDQRGPDEVELVYSGLMRNARGAQASAAHWESKRLSDDDIEDLGYGPEEPHP